MTRLNARQIRIVLWISLALILLAVGCASLDHFFTPDPETGTSPATDVGNTIVDVSTGIGFPEWGQIAIGVLGVLGSGYLIFRRIQKKIKGTAA